MFSHRLASDRSVEPPIHASFADSEDLLGILWLSGAVELWDVRVPSFGRSMPPTGRSILWRGNFPSGFAWRQISVHIIKCDGKGIAEFKVILAALGLKSHHHNDCLIQITLQGAKELAMSSMALPHPNGRLVNVSELPIVWQSPSGNLYTGENCQFKQVK